MTLGLTFGMLLVATPAFAMDLTVEGAVEQALQTNSQIQLQELGLEAALDQKRRTLESVEDMRDFEFGGVPYVPGLTMDITSSSLLITTAQAELLANLAEAGVTAAKESVKYGVEVGYYGALLAERSAEVSQASVERAQKQLDNAKAKEQQGMSSKLDVTSAEANLLQAQAEANQSKANAKMAKMRLCQLMGIKTSTELNLTSQMSFTEKATPSQTALFIKGQDTDYATYSAFYNKQVNVLVAEETMGQYPSNTWQYSQAAMDKKAAEVDYQNALNSLEVQVSQAIIDLDTARDNYKSLSKSKELAQEAYRLAQLQYENGLCSPYDLLSAETSLKEAELGQLSALYNYTVACLKVEYGIFTTAGV